MRKHSFAILYGNLILKLRYTRTYKYACFSGFQSINFDTSNSNVYSVLLFSLRRVTADDDG